MTGAAPVGVFRTRVEWIDTDELVEVTPKGYRIRKRMLSETERKRVRRAATA